MFAGKQIWKLTVGLAAALALGVTVGCNEDQKTASIGAASQQWAMASADGSLGAGDSLGSQVFNAGTSGMAVIRQTDSAAAVAEAKVKDGSYDQWYASFDRDPEHLAAAKAKQAQDEGLQPSKSITDTVVDAPIPLPVH